MLINNKGEEYLKTSASDETCFRKGKHISTPYENTIKSILVEYYCKYNLFTLI